MAAKRKNTSLEQLRDVARARHQAANRKVGRLRSKGVDVANTKFDVRRSVRNIDRYTTKQLATYINSLNNFVDRKTAFVADVHGRPIEASKWREYKRLERKQNKITSAEYEALKNIRVPGREDDPSSWETIEQRQAKITSAQRHAAASVNNPYSPVQRKPRNFKSDKALKQMIAKMNKKLASDFLTKDLSKDREVVEQMTKTLNRPDIQARVDKLTDAQFNVLFNFLGFADKISTPYELAKEELAGNEEPWYGKIATDNLSEAERLLGYAETLKLGS